MAYTDNITGYISTYILVPSSFANAGDTGLTISTAYACFKIADPNGIGDLTEAQAAETGGSSSFRQLVHALTKQFYDDIQAITEADRPTRLTIDKGLQGDGSGNVNESHTVTSTQSTDGAVISEPA